MRATLDRYPHPYSRSRAYPIRPYTTPHRAAGDTLSALWEFVSPHVVDGLMFTAFVAVWAVIFAIVLK